MSDEIIKQEMSNEIRAVRLSIFRLNAFGVVATLAFIGGRLGHSTTDGYGIEAFVVLVLFIVGTILGLIGRFGSVYSDVKDWTEELRSRFEKMSEEEKKAIGPELLDPVESNFLIRQHDNITVLSAICGTFATFLALIILWQLA
ncbi:MAG: hypothetical protein RH946_03915 [Rhodospirillales bacterium]